MLAFVNANLIDGFGTAPRVRQRVLIDGDKIISIGRYIPIPQDAQVVDLSGKTLMPGLIDCHVHMGNGYRKGIASGTETEEYKDLRNVCLANGITAVRSGGDYYRDCIAVRNKLLSGELRGPRMQVCGKHFMDRGSHPASTVWGSEETIENCGAYPDSPAQGREMVREFTDLGMDYIKIIVSESHHSVWPKKLPQISENIVEAIIDESHKLGMTTACHVETLKQAMMVAEYGTNEIHHLMMTASEVSEVPAYEPLFRKMCEDNIWLVPTIVVPRKNEPMRIARGVGGCNINHAVAVNRCAYEFGVNFGCGTDSGSPGLPWGPTLHSEMDEYVENFGMTPLEAIRCATYNNAKLMGLEGVTGQIKVGTCADLLILSKDPSKDIYNTRTINTVVHNGKIVFGEGTTLTADEIPNPKRTWNRW